MTSLVCALDANAGALLSYLERRIGIDDAPDALAEVMSVVWRREADLPEDATEARMWMFGIAKGVVANAVRGKVRRARLEQLTTNSTRESRRPFSNRYTCRSSSHLLKSRDARGR